VAGPYPDGVTDDPPRDPEPIDDVAPVRPRPATWDVWLTILLLVPLAVLAMSASYSGMMAGTTGGGCGGSCDGPSLTIGLVLMTFSPIVLFFAALFVGIRRLSRGKRAFWAPLAAFVALAVLWYAGVALTRFGAI